MPRETGSVPTTTEAERQLTLRRRAANVFMGPVGGLTYQTENARPAPASPEKSWKKKIGKALGYPFKVGGMTLLGGGGLAGEILYFAGKGIKLALGPGVKAGIHYDKEFGNGFDSTWKPIMEWVNKNRKK